MTGLFFFSTDFVFVPAGGHQAMTGLFFFSTDFVFVPAGGDQVGAAAEAGAGELVAGGPTERQERRGRPPATHCRPCGGGTGGQGQGGENLRK